MKTVSTTINLKSAGPGTVRGAIAELKGTVTSPSKEALLAQLAEIEAREAEVKEEELRAQEADKSRRQKEYEDLLTDAELNEKLSLEASTPYDKKYYANEARDIRIRIREQYAEFAAAAGETGTEPTLKSEVRTSFAFKQAAVIAGILLFAIVGFLSIRGYIMAQNAAAISGTAEGNTAVLELSYSWDSFQKIFFFMLVACVHIVSVLGLIYVVNPNIFKYTLSFLKTDPSAQSDFINHLTPWQRQKNTTLLILGFLLYLAILFSGKI